MADQMIALIIIMLVLSILLMKFWIIKPLQEDNDRLSEEKSFITNEFMKLHSRNISDKISRRDYFVAKVMNGNLSVNNSDDFGDFTTVEDLVEYSYFVADAMLKERNKPKNQ